MASSGRRCWFHKEVYLSLWEIDPISRLIITSVDILSLLLWSQSLVYGLYHQSMKAILYIMLPFRAYREENRVCVFRVWPRPCRGAHDHVQARHSCSDMWLFGGFYARLLLFFSLKPPGLIYFLLAYIWLCVYVFVCMLGIPEAGCAIRFSWNYFFFFFFFFRSLQHAIQFISFLFIYLCISHPAVNLSAATFCH